MTQRTAKGAEDETKVSRSGAHGLRTGNGMRPSGPVCRPVHCRGKEGMDDGAL